MGVLIRKQKGVYLFTKIARLSIVGFIVAVAFSLIDTIWAVYMDGFLNSIVLVGFLSAFLTIISFLSYFLIVPLIEKTSKSRLYLLSLILFSISYVLFAINTRLYFFVILAIVITILTSIKVTSYGIIVRDKSHEKSLSRNEGVSYTFMNLAWVIGPLIAGYVSNKFGVSLVFILSAIFFFLGFLTFSFLRIDDKNIKKKADFNFFKNFKDFFKSRDRTLAYILGGGVNLWWILIYLFIPIYIIRNGLHEMTIGYFLFGVAVPLILFQYLFSRLAGKIGFKKIFAIGFFIPAVISFLCFFMVNIHAILILLILASIGLSMLEATTESYFFDLLKRKQDSRFYGPYNTTIEVNHLIGKLVPAVLLIFLPFKYIFLFFGLFMLSLSFVSLKIKNVIEARRDGKRN